METLEKRLRRLHTLRSIDAPAAILDGAVEKARENLADALERGWSGAAPALPPELDALARELR